MNESISDPSEPEFYADTGEALEAADPTVEDANPEATLMDALDYVEPQRNAVTP